MGHRRFAGDGLGGPGARHVRRRTLLAGLRRVVHNLAMGTWSVHAHGDPPKAVVALAEQVERDGGIPLALYREPVGDHWHVFCLLPMAKVEPTPYQRDV